MTVEQNNVARLKEAYQLWSETEGGSIEHWLNLAADNIDFRSLADGAAGAEFTQARASREDMRKYLNELCADWTMVFHTMDEFVAQGDQVVAIGNCAWRCERTGKTVETPKVDVWRFRDGKAVFFFEFYDTAKVFAAAS